MAARVAEPALAHPRRSKPHHHYRGTDQADFKSIDCADFRPLPYCLSSAVDLAKNAKHRSFNQW
jgi:hypothetical protein